VPRDERRLPRTPREPGGPGATSARDRLAPLENVRAVGRRDGGAHERSRRRRSGGPQSVGRSAEPETDRARRVSEYFRSRRGTVTNREERAILERNRGHEGREGRARAPRRVRPRLGRRRPDRTRTFRRGGRRGAALRDSRCRLPGRRARPDGRRGRPRRLRANGSLFSPGAGSERSRARHASRKALRQRRAPRRVQVGGCALARGTLSLLRGRRARREAAERRGDRRGRGRIVPAVFGSPRDNREDSDLRRVGSRVDAPRGVDARVSRGGGSNRPSR
jgi:hypothetical protein